jgi:hypothetical protein
MRAITEGTVVTAPEGMVKGEVIGKSENRVRTNVRGFLVM